MSDSDVQEIPFDFKLESRTEGEILEKIEEFRNKIWFDRHILRRSQDNWLEVPKHIREKAHEAAQEKIEKYGEENLGPYTDFEWGMLSGKLSALRWVMGDEWDMLDTQVGSSRGQSSRFLPDRMRDRGPPGQLFYGGVAQFRRAAALQADG